MRRGLATKRDALNIKPCERESGAPDADFCLAAADEAAAAAADLGAPSGPAPPPAW